MELKTYFNIIVRRWWIILLVMLAIGVASIYASKLVLPVYETVTTLRVVTPIGGPVGNISYQTGFADRLMNTYAQIAASDKVMNEVKSKLGVPKLPDVVVKTVPNSEIIEITVSGPDPVLAMKTANTLSAVIIEQSQQVAASGNGNSQDVSILLERQTTLQNGLDQAKTDYDALVESYSKTTAQLSILDRTIQLKEARYQNLQNQYLTAGIDGATSYYKSTQVPAKTTQDILSGEMSKLETEIAGLRTQFEDLSAKSVSDAQRLIPAEQLLQNQQSAYTNLLSQIDAARIASSKYDNGQDVVIASPAILPTKSTGPTSTLIIGLGFLCGLIAGILMAFLVNTLDTHVLSVEQVERLTSLPILGSLPNLSRKDRHAPLESSDIKVQRAYWTLCTKIMTLQKNKAAKTILVTSPNPAEGKSTIIMAVAEGLAKANRKVLIVDADLRKSGLGKVLNATGEHGLSKILRGKETLQDAVQVLPNTGIHFLPSGTEEGDPTSLFEGPAFANLLGKFSAYDVVLFDSPAMLAVPDANSLAGHMDGIMVVVQRKRTKVEDIRAILSQLEDVKPQLMGTIVNRVPLKRVSGYYQRKNLSPANVSSKPA